MQTYLGARNGIIVNKLETIVAQTALGRGSGGTPSSESSDGCQSLLLFGLVPLGGAALVVELGLVGAYKIDLSLLALSFMPAYSCKEASVFCVGSNKRV